MTSDGSGATQFRESSSSSSRLVNAPAAWIAQHSYGIYLFQSYSVLFGLIRLPASLATWAIYALALARVSVAAFRFIESRLASASLGASTRSRRPAGFRQCRARCRRRFGGLVRYSLNVQTQRREGVAGYLADPDVGRAHCDHARRVASIAAGPKLGIKAGSMALDPARAPFRFYAKLNDHLPPGRRYRTVEGDFFVSASIKDKIESFGVPPTGVDLTLVHPRVPVLPSPGAKRRSRRSLSGSRIAGYHPRPDQDVQALARQK